ncbi:hypothetical protein CERZMDRAFT_114196 [Cercospora zeae-maydis SCOH1-5]|uniref:Major facilitator superfamily (MFS) profile domain-containing protein n=1 Tax=Cercospora zeae-maydis SCOH1-5 TaxID=717836 RepID=A0A6A6F5H0_9PEZI|nr:hypothetical protein CERZMDRAFT_114196 [Cercospora zeae-maydis SCOH1-5]
MSSVAFDASRAEEAEHLMSIRQGLKLYPKAIGWSVLLSSALIMEGFQTTMLPNLFSQPAFQERFGIHDGKGGYQISAPWQSGLSNGAGVGGFIGLFFAGTSTERFGYRKTMMVALAAITGFIFVVFFANSLTMLLVGEILCGLCWGIFQTTTMTYASEVCPVALRAYLTTYCNLCWVIGQFVAACVLKAVANKTGEYAYKIPFAVQWIWPIPILIGVYFAPESPWWLVRKERFEDATKALLRLTSPGRLDNFDPQESISMMVYTTELERSQQEGTTYLDCFKGADLRRTEVVCLTYAVQNLCGSTIMGYSTYFMIQAGMSPSHSFGMSIGQYGMGAIGTISSWFMMSKVGRRTLYLYGTAILGAALLVVGGLGSVSTDNTDAQWAIGAVLLTYTFIYDATVGPVCYSLVPELSSTRLRNKSVVLARNLYNIIGIVLNVLTPRMLNPTAWAWGAKAAYFWVGSCALCCTWIYFRLPEPKGRTYAELDVLFKNGTPARKFKSTVVDPFADVLGTEKQGELKSGAVHIDNVGDTV